MTLDKISVSDVPPTEERVGGTSDSVWANSVPELPLKKVGPSDAVWTRPLTPDEMEALMEHHLCGTTDRISSDEEAYELL